MQKFLLVFIFLLIFKIEASTFHAILIGDTNDHELKKVVAKDILHMETHINRVFDRLDVDYLEQTIYTGNHVNKNILVDLKNLNVEPDDIIFLYYTGHGFYSDKQNAGTWPYLYLSNDRVGINEYKILEILMEHHPRLIICFADCCNNILNKKRMPEILAHTGIDLKKVQTNIHKLFLEDRGVIMISSAAPGFYAEGTDEKGSFFTNCYLHVFEKAVVSQENINWNEILSEVQKTLWKRQHPQYELLLN